MKKQTFGFLDRVNTKKLPKEVSVFVKWCMKNLGEPCRSFAPRCENCEVWISLERIATFFEE